MIQGRQSSQIDATDPKFAHRPIQTAGIIAYLHKDKISEKKKTKVMMKRQDDKNITEE